MKVYLDYIFLENFFIDFLLISETALISKIELNKKRGVVSSTISAIYVVVMVFFKINEFNFLICKILLVFVIVYIAFKPSDFICYIKLTLLFLLVTIINLGSVTFLATFIGITKTNSLNKVLIYPIGFIFSKLGISQFWKIYKREIKIEDLIYEVKFKIEGKMYKYNAFLDTGNNVYSYFERLPVLFAKKKDNIEKSLKTSDLRNFDVETVTLNRTSKKKAYIIENIEISKKRKKWNVTAAIVFEDINFSGGNEYDMILNYTLFIEKMGGITI